jgi:RNA recognition motif-containing protein
LIMLICSFFRPSFPGFNDILFTNNLNYQIIGEDLYDLFGCYKSKIQIRIDNEVKTKGTAFVVFDDVMDVRNSFYLPSSLDSKRLIRFVTG